MTRKEYEKKMRKRVEDPDNTPGFTLVPNRYYLGLWFLPLPEPLCRFGAKEGDLTMQVHRQLDTLTEWTMKYRFRYYLGPNPSDPFSVNDRKEWRIGRIKGPAEAELKIKMETIMHALVYGGQMIAGGIVQPGPFEYLELCCNGLEAMDKLIKANKHWLHIKAAEELEKENYFPRLARAKQNEQAARDVEKTQPGQG
jgi:hypothetical protein